MKLFRLKRNAPGWSLWQICCWAFGTAVTLTWFRMVYRMQRFHGDRVFLDKSRRDDEKNQQDEDHIQHWREVNSGVFRNTFCSTAHDQVLPNTVCHIITICKYVT